MTRLIRSAILVALAGLSTVASAQDCDEPAPTEMMKIHEKMMVVMGPGPEHEILASMAGSWKAEVSMWMAPGAEPVKSPMTTTAELALGGRFVLATSKGSMMGMPVESITYYGYDRRHKHYTLVGFDTMGTYYITATGKYDAATKTIDFHGTDEEPIGGLTQDYNFHLKFNDDGSHQLTLIFNCPTFGNDGPFKLMEWVSTKADG